jgi:hypothetical protein
MEVPVRINSTTKLIERERRLIERLRALGPVGSPNSSKVKRRVRVKAPSRVVTPETAR